MQVVLPGERSGERKARQFDARADDRIDQIAAGQARTRSIQVRPYAIGELSVGADPGR